MDKRILISFFIILFLIGFPADYSFAYFDADEIILIKEDGGEIKITKEDISEWVTPESSLEYVSEYRSEIEPINYCETSPIICSLTDTQRFKQTLKKVDKSVLNKESVRSFIEDLARKYDKDPIDAVFTIENGKVSTFSLSKDGKKINIDKNTENLISVFLKNTEKSARLEIIYDTIKPNVSSNDADKLGIETLIGEGKSNFSGSTQSRIHNVQVAASRFDGVLIKPGEEFSFVETLGPVDGEHGYKQELVIKNNETTPEFGGGVCQVSTTAFRAAIYSGLEITARKNHAYPVHYYNPQGMDATVYIPRPDLRFKNNTPGHILIQTEIDIAKKELIFKFYGKNDGRKTEIDGPHILSREADGSMKTVFTQKVMDANGNIMIDDIFRSNYDSPNKYPKPGQESTITEKPEDWSTNEWKKYKKEHGL